MSNLPTDHAVDTTSHHQKIDSYLADLKSQKRYRVSKTIENLSIDFCSNDYLNLRRSSKLKTKVLSHVQHTSMGSGASRLLGGGDPHILELEHYFAAWKQAQTATFFSSGYLANLAVVSALHEVDAEFFSDELIHASMIDGLRLSQANKKIYPHLDFATLDEQLSESSSSVKVVLSESVFSMDGDLVAIDQLVQVCRKHQALLVLDEAHAIGVFGLKGSGMSSRVRGFDDLITINPCGKAIGISGALVCGPEWMQEMMLNASRSLIYTTSPSPWLAVAVRCSVGQIKQMEVERLILQENISYVRDELGLKKVKGGASAIVPLIVGSNENALDLQNYLNARGMYVAAVRPPTVAQGTSRLRIVLHAGHTRPQLQKLCSSIKQFFEDRYEFQKPNIHH